MEVEENCQQERNLSSRTCSPEATDSSTPPEADDTSVKLPLHGVICRVETGNGLHSDASSKYEAILASLGATITKYLSEQVAYYVVPPQLVGVVEKRILAAELLGIAVVSPSWVEQCNESHSHVAAVAAEHAVKGSLRATSASPLVEAQPSTVTTDDKVAAKPVQVVEEAPAAGITTDSPCNSVGTDNTGFRPVSHASENGNLLQHALMSSKATERSASSSALSAGMTRTRSAESLPQQQRQQTSVSLQPAILLPSFREIVPPVVPAEVLEKVQKRRRSERICDLIEDDSDEEFFAGSGGGGKRAKGPQDPESWEAVCRISALQELPVIYEPGQDGDVLVIAPIVPSAAASACSRRAAAASGIQGLSVKGRKEKSAPPAPSAKAAKVVVKAEKISKTSSSRVATGRTQAQAAAEEVPDEPAAPKAKVVIALTGFDDKYNDKDTLNQTLRQFVKAAKKGLLSESAAKSDSGTGSASALAGSATDSGTPLQTRRRGRPPLSATQRLERALGTTPGYNESSSSSSASVDRALSAVGGATEGLPAGWLVEPNEASVSVLKDPNDFSAVSCTHVVVNTKSSKFRTLRTLFALVRGLCIVTEEWAYQSMKQDAWADVRSYLHPRYSSDGSLGSSRADLFRGKTICVLDSANPPTEVLIELIRAAGAKVSNNPSDLGVALVVFGDLCSANEWVARKLRKHQSDTHKEVHNCRALAAQRKTVTAKFVFNCIEEGALRAARDEGNELVGQEHLMVFNFSDRVIAEAAASSPQPFITTEEAAEDVQRAQAAQKSAPVYREYWIDEGSKALGGGSKNAPSSSAKKGELKACQPAKAAAVADSSPSIKTSAEPAGRRSLSRDGAAEARNACAAPPVLSDEPAAPATGLRRALRNSGGLPAADQAAAELAEQQALARLNKHAVRDTTGKFKSLKTRQAEAAAFAAALAAQAAAGMSANAVKEEHLSSTSNNCESAADDPKSTGAANVGGEGAMDECGDDEASDEAESSARDQGPSPASQDGAPSARSSASSHRASPERVEALSVHEEAHFADGDAEEDCGSRSGSDDDDVAHSLQGSDTSGVRDGDQHEGADDASEEYSDVEMDVANQEEADDLEIGASRSPSANESTGAAEGLSEESPRSPRSSPATAAEAPDVPDNATPVKSGEAEAQHAASSEEVVNMHDNQSCEGSAPCDGSSSARPRSAVGVYAAAAEDIGAGGEQPVGDQWADEDTPDEFPLPTGGESDDEDDEDGEI